MAKRNNYSPSFKAKMALEALHSERTLSELAAKYEIHPQLLTKWKRQAADLSKEWGPPPVATQGGREKVAA